MEKIIQELNEMLIGETFDKEQFESLIKTLNCQFKLILFLVDIEFYNEKRIENVQQEKRAGIESLNFDWARMQRSIEKYCKEILDLKEKHQIEKSIFLKEDIYLYYCHIGTSKNDKQAKECFFDLSTRHAKPYFQR